MLQNLVVEPERDADGEPTGSYFVTIGEGRRLAHLLAAGAGAEARPACHGHDSIGGRRRMELRAQSGAKALGQSAKQAS